MSLPTLKDLDFFYKHFIFTLLIFFILYIYVICFNCAARGLLQQNVVLTMTIKIILIDLAHLSTLIIHTLAHTHSCTYTHSSTHTHRHAHTQIHTHLHTRRRQHTLTERERERERDDRMGERREAARTGSPEDRDTSSSCFSQLRRPLE